MPTVSIIMPAYNAEKFIAQAIESIIQQTYTEWELLICDDGSTDNTLRIAQSYTDPRIHVYKNRKNIGNLKTTNFLFAQCRGTYIGIQDADDTCDVQKLELQIAAFNKDPELGIVGTQYMLTDEELQATSCSLLPTHADAVAKTMEKEVPPLLYASILVKRELVERVGYFRPIFNRKGFADLDWLFRICEITKAINVKNILYYYRRHDEQFTHTSAQDLIQKHAHILLQEAHNYRLQKKKDFFESENYCEIRSIIAKSYVKQAEILFWNNNKTKAIKILFNALRIYPCNITIYKTLIYILKH